METTRRTLRIKGAHCFVMKYNPQYTTKPIKDLGLDIMVWGCFSYQGVGPIYWIRNTMDATEYMKILDEIMPPYASYEMILNTSAKNGLQIPQ